MNRLPRLSGRDAIKAFGRLATKLIQRGSHVVLRHKESPFRRLVVPDHKELATGTLRALIREAGLTAAEFQALL